MTVLRRSLLAFGGADTTLAILNAIAVLALAATSFGWLDAILEDVQERLLAIVSLGWFGTLLCFFTPYRMWRDEREKVNEMASTQAAALTARSRLSDDGHYAELVVTNISTKSVEGVNVELKLTRRVNGDHLQDLDFIMTTTGGRACPVDINPNNSAYFRFARVLSARKGRLGVEVFGGSGKGNQSFREGAVVIKFNISSKEVPRFPHFVQVGDQGAGNMSVVSQE